MALENSAVARVLDRIADLLELCGQNPFRVRAYRTAARTVDALAEPLARRLRAGPDLAELPGIGQDLANKIRVIVETGTHPLVAELGRDVPETLLELLSVPGLGPKRVQALHRELGVLDARGLLDAARGGRVRTLRGFGKRSESAIVEALEKRVAQPAAPRRTLASVGDVAREIAEWLRAAPGVERIELAGSFRRCCETVGDLDVLASARSGASVVKRFVSFPEVERVAARGSTRAAVVLRSGLAVDLRAVRPEAFGSALLYFTGSKEHSVQLRRRALERKLKLNEYGVWRGRRRIAGRNEEDVYAALGLPWIAPELRENRGELEAAELGALPRLVEPADLRGDLHVHTSRTDGRNTLEEMARAAAARGHAYLAITDHTRSLPITHGFDPRRARASLQEIRSLACRLAKPKLLAGVEVDILEDGRLDLPDRVLAEMDFVVAAVHSHFSMDRKAMTRRIIRAMRNRWVHALAHPTGRLLGRREPYPLDLEEVASAAAAEGVWLELNGQPERMDLGDLAARAAHERGARVIVSSDAHSVDELRYLELGLSIARRAWLRKEDIVNTLSAQQLEKQLAARRR